MTYSGKIAENSDSLIELLSAQCGDLEMLLALSREETNAIERGNFESVLDIVSKRAELGNRLESRHPWASVRRAGRRPLYRASSPNSPVRIRMACSMV